MRLRESSKRIVRRMDWEYAEMNGGRGRSGDEGDDGDSDCADNDCGNCGLLLLSSPLIPSPFQFPPAVDVLVLIPFGVWFALSFLDLRLAKSDLIVTLPFPFPPPSPPSPPPLTLVAPLTRPASILC